MSIQEKPLYDEIVLKSNIKNKSFRVGTKTYRGISTVNPENTNSTLYDLALIKQDIINHFHIRQGEKLSDPTFGTVLWDILFEPLTQEIKNLVINNVTRIIGSDPRVTVNGVIVDEYETGLSIECDLIYYPYNIQEKMSLQFDRNAGFLSL